jgi:hypothetical protein
VAAIAPGHGPSPPPTRANTAGGEELGEQSSPVNRAELPRDGRSPLGAGAVLAGGTRLLGEGRDQDGVLGEAVLLLSRRRRNRGRQITDLADRLGGAG